MMRTWTEDYLYGPTMSLTVYMAHIRATRHFKYTSSYLYE